MSLRSSFVLIFLVSVFSFLAFSYGSGGPIGKSQQDEQKPLTSYFQISSSDVLALGRDALLTEADQRNSLPFVRLIFEDRKVDAATFIQNFIGAVYSISSDVTCSAGASRIDGNSPESYFYNYSHEPNYIDVFKREYPYISRLLNAGSPRAPAVNKWVMPISISLGMPNNLLPLSNSKSKEPFIKTSHAHSVQMEDVVSANLIGIVGLLSDSTGLPVSFVRNADETTGKFSEMRIILPEESQGRTDNTETFTGTDKISNFEFHDLIMRRIHGAVSFSSSKLTGYYVANKDNEIIFSACYLSVGVEHPDFKSQIDECLFRSLGLAGTSGLSRLLSKVSSNNTTRNKNMSSINNYAIEMAFLRMLYEAELHAGTDPRSAHDYYKALLNTQFNHILEEGK